MNAEVDSGAPHPQESGHERARTIKAIETRYAGCRFRSRLEARWAVFFDTLGLRWEYEPEGFELPSGRYLPDFKVWSSRANSLTWWEVKPAPSDMAPDPRWRELVKITGINLRVTYGMHRPGDDCATSHGAQHVRIRNGILSTFRVAGANGSGSPSNVVNGMSERGFEAAASARFEFGESGTKRTDQDPFA